MSSGGGTTTQINKTEYPEWVQEAGRRNLAAAYDISANMLGPYEGQRVANMSDAQMNTIGGLTNNISMAQPAFAYAQKVAANTSNYQPQNVQAGQLASTNLDAYMNPYTQNVIQSSLDTLNQQRQTGLNQAYANAVQSKAFGGSRQGIQEAVINAAAQKQAGDLASNLYSQNFQQAQQAATGDINRAMQAGLANQQAGLQAGALNLQGANALGNLATAGQQSFLQGSSAALGGQQLIQQNQQQNLDAAIQAYTEQQQFPLQQLQIPLQALGATPYGGTQTQTTSGSGGSGLASGLGAAASAASIIASIAGM